MSTLDLGELRISYKLDKDGLKRGLREGELEVRASGDRQGRSVLETALAWARNVVHGWGQAGQQASSKFWQDATGRWHNAAGQFVSAAMATGQAAGQAASGGFGIFSTIIDSASKAGIKLSANLGNLIFVLLATAAALALVIPATQLLGGVLGAIPALTTGGIAAIATLGLGFLGLTDAFKKTSASGGSAVDRLHQVAMAERRVADANREVTASTEALNRARKTAAERLRDLTLSLSGARLDEADALDAVAKAKRDLERATEGDNPEQIRAARRAVERAEQSYAEARDRLEDLSEEQEDAAQKGVEGSDEVTAALDRQRRATEGVTDAAYDLRQAQKPAAGGGAAAEAMKIAASAMAAVAAIKSLSGEANSLRLDVQERIFSGTDVEIKSLWAAWIPTLRERLGSMGDMFNGLFKKWATTSRKPEFIANIAAGWASVEKLIDRVFSAVAGPGLEAFGKLSKAAGPMADAIGDVLGGVVDWFGAWIDKAEKSGALKEFFEDAGQFFRDAASIGGSTVRIIGSVIDILMGATKERREDVTKGLVENMRDLADWFADPKNSEKIEGWFKEIESWFYWIVNTAIPTVAGWIRKIDEWADRIKGWVDKAVEFKNGVVSAIDAVTGAVTGMPVKIATAAIGMFDPIKNAFKSAMNWVIDTWNNLTFGGLTIQAPGLNNSGSIKGKGMPRLGGGGLVRATPGGRDVNVAEAGQDEIVSPVEQMRQIVAEELARVQNEGGSKYVDVHVHVGDEVTRVIRVELKEHDRQNKRSATAGAGTR